MKKILFAALAAVLASCASAPGAAPAAPPAQASATSASAAKPAAPRQENYQEPLPVSIKSFYANGDPSGTVTTKYTVTGRLASQETLNGNGVLVETRAGQTKGDVWRITVTNAQSNEVISYEDQTFDAKGELLSQVFLNAKEVPQASNEFAYDAAGRKVSWLVKTGSGVLQSKTVYTYDSHGNNTKSELYDAGGTLTNVFVSTYDDQGNIQSKQGFDAAQNLVEQTNFTWKNGQKIKEETVKPLLRTKEYTYTDTTAAPSEVLSSVRGKVVERQVFQYQWFTRTRTVTP